MKRFAIFILLGPPIGLLSLHVFTWATHKSAYPFWVGSEVISTMFFGAYILGFLPAFATAIADWLLSAVMHGWRRVLASTLAGYVFTVALSVMQASPKSAPFLNILAFSGIGAMSAAVCSWLSLGVEFDEPQPRSPRRLRGS